METNLKALLHRLRVANFDSNKNQKYRLYTRSDDFFHKVANKSDEMMRVSYALAVFLTATPPKYREPPNTLQTDEEVLVDYDATAANGDGFPERQHSKTWVYHHDDYSVYDLQALPITQEAQFDSNLMMFHSFLAFIKPANYFVAKFEMSAPLVQETRKQNATRVLVNLTQLLLFSRSVQGTEDVRDVFTVIFCLFCKFSSYFSLLGNGGEPSLETANFFDLFPTESAFFLRFMLAYDNYDQCADLEQLKSELKKTLDVELFPETSEGFQRALESHRPILDAILDDSKTTAELISRLQATVDFDFLRSCLLDISKVLTAKILFTMNDFAEWQLQRDYLDMNYEQIFNNLKLDHEREIDGLRAEIEKEINDREENTKMGLKSKLETFEIDSQRLREENAIQEQELLILKNENDCLKKELSMVENMPQGRSELTYQDIEKYYPKLLKEIKNTTYRLSIKKAHTRITDLEDELTKLRRMVKSGPPPQQQQQQQQHSVVENSAVIRAPDHVEEPYSDFYGDRSACHEPDRNINNCGTQSFESQSTTHGYQTGYGGNRSSYSNGYNSGRPANRGWGGGSSYRPQQRRHNN